MLFLDLYRVSHRMLLGSNILVLRLNRLLLVADLSLDLILFLLNLLKSFLLGLLVLVDFMQLLLILIVDRVELECQDFELLFGLMVPLLSVFGCDFELLLVSLPLFLEMKKLDKHGFLFILNGLLLTLQSDYLIFFRFQI